VAQTIDHSAAASATQTLSTHELIHSRIVRWLEQEASISVERIDYDAPLLELGIDSLGVASIAEELEQETNKTFNPEVLFELETISDLAEYLDGLQPRAPLPVAEPPAGAEICEPADLPTIDSVGVVESTSPIKYFARLNRRVNSLKQQGLYFFEPEISEHDGAWVVADGTRMLMLGSYEYLGLLGHPHLKQTAIAAIEQFGTGHHGVRLLAGTTTIHRQLEKKLASFMHAEDAVVFSSGYVTNLGTMLAFDEESRLLFDAVAPAHDAEHFTGFRGGQV